MRIDRKELEHIAALARLELNEDEILQSAEQLSQILDYMSVINELDLTDCETLSHSIGQENVSRPDELKPGLPVKEVLENAPEALPPYFKVPRVIE
ncbi:MAG TPA: Asp-tRNA(Asn)/Glu-tRNA(Gln) amidotransferase subunit GatC [Candidatus Marinimicrobia bacterium]|nr:Asp-tRNA(Asn)/Glu-tRNA(Gln) amidotransferase subunit GatC [Candidatus Neomarinimicrobiota bacterium]